MDVSTALRWGRSHLSLSLGGLRRAQWTEPHSSSVLAGSVVGGMVGGRIVGSVLVARGKGEVKLGGAARVGVGGGCTRHPTYVIHLLVTDATRRATRKMTDQTEEPARSDYQGLPPHAD